MAALVAVAVGLLIYYRRAATRNLDSRVRPPTAPAEPVSDRRGFRDDPRAEEPLRSAMGAARGMRDYRELERLARTLLGEIPDDLAGLLACGQACLRLGRGERAEESLRQALRQASAFQAFQASQASSEERELIHLELSGALVYQGRYREALVELAGLLADNPFHRLAYLQLGKSLARLERTGLSRRFLELAQSLAPGDGEDRRADQYEGSRREELGWRYRARACALRGQYGEGERVLRAAASRGSPGLQVYLAEYLIGAGRAGDALRVLDRLAEMVGASHPDVQGWRAMAFRSQGKSAPAADILAGLLRQHPQLIEVWAPRLARLLLEDLAAPEAAAGWLRAYQARRHGIEAGVLLARAWYALDRPGDAAATLDRLSPLHPGWKRADGDLWRAMVLLRLGDSEQVGGLLPALGRRFHHMPEYFYLRAGWLLATGSDGAETAAAATAARDRGARLEKQHAEARRLRWQAARAEGEEAAEPFCAVARLHHEMGDRQEALRLARIATSCAPDDPTAWLLLAEWYDEPQEVFLRAAARRRSVEVDPTAPSPPTPPTSEEIVKAWLNEEVDR